MAYMILYVLDNVGQMSEVLNAWERAGVVGVTIFDTTGVARLRQAGLRDDLPLLPSLIDLLADGGAEARRVKKEFQPRLTKGQYLELMQRLS